MIGTALGAAVSGLRPVVEIMYADFLLVAMDQIVDQVANARYVSRGRLVPRLTIRTQQGATPGSCAQHSQSLEALFAHVPGLHVCLPSNAAEAYGMLRTAVAGGRPPSWSSRVGASTRSRPSCSSTRRSNTSGAPASCWKAAASTVACWGTAVSDVLAGGTTLEAAGIRPEVVDLRWLSPLDLDPGARVHRADGTPRSRARGEPHGRLRRRGGRPHQPEAGGPGVPSIRMGAEDTRIPASSQFARAVLPTTSGSW